MRQKLRALLIARTLLAELVEIAWRLPSEPIELILSIEAMGFGLVLAASPDMFARSLSFAAMARIAPQDVWSVIAGLLGAGLLCGLMFRNVAIRRWCLLLMWMFWLFVTAQIWLVTLNTGVSTYGGLALAAAIAHLRLDLQRKP